MAALTGALLALTAAKTASSFVDGRRQANAAVQQGNYQGGVYDQNAALADNQSTDAISRGRQAEIARGTATNQTVGAQRASYAASGVNVGNGSALDVQADTARMGALDQLTIKRNAAMEAFGYGVDATNARNAANFARTGGQNTAAGLRRQATGTLLTGALDAYQIGSQSGMFGSGKRGGATASGATASSTTTYGAQ